ncbi:ras-related protein Rab-44 [Cygnus atratus]|uniref:ras-related protein Rab-44 n=1 Tax=Cygnus atratus TaxID=8868 RepID=UPI0021B8314D|nr:ras-related protein Rab-44 [Cygnus atratus]
MAEHRAGAKGRRMGSSRRRQLCKDPGRSEEPPWASKVMQRVQDFIQGHHKDQTGFITRSDMQKLQENDFPCSTEELELLFDGLDAAGTGRLNTEEFVAGLWQFLSSQKASRDHRQRKTASWRNSILAGPLLEGVDSEEQKHFAAFMDQLGTDDISEDRQEIWQLWAKLRKDEPQLLGNLEDFLAKMRHRIQEARSKKEALEVTLNKCMAEHNLEVQRLCAAMEQQIQQEQQRLMQESMARSHLHGMELQRVLDASEREVQRLVAAQVELETRCHSLRSMQQAASTEKQQLEESNRVLEKQLQHINLQLQQTHGCLWTTWATVAQEHKEELQDRAVAELPGETPPSLQMSPEQSEKYCSEMQIRLGSRVGKPQRKNTHQVVWEKLPAETSISGLPRALSVEEDPFPEFLKEEQFSDQGSLLREMNDAIAALSVQLVPQAPATPTALAEAACCLQDDAEPQTGPEAAALHGSAVGAPQDTHVGHKLFKVDLREGRTAAELPARDMTQAAVAALHQEYASATAHPYPDVILVALNDPDEQVLEENQALEIFQEESGDAKGRPLDGAQGLEVVQGARLEAETRILPEVQHLELKQGHDTNAATLASPVSEVPLQISTLNWDTVMQEDVLIPDVQWLGGSGQAAQSELLEQVSSQADKVRLHAAPQQPQEKPPCVTETERVAAGPAEPPKQEVPPVSAFCTRVQEEEDTGNDLLGMNLGDSTLVDAANSRVQPQRHLSGEWREDLDVGQPEKKKEIGQKMSQEGEPSPGEPGAMTVNGAGASPRGSSEVSLDPDYLYNVLFVGDSHVGKTSFLYRLHANTFNPHLTATVGLDYQVKSLIVDNKHFALRLWDSAGQERYHSITKQFFRKADGVVLMYDITSQYSFADVRYWLSCIQEGAEDGVTILLLGNKTDCATERQVPTQEAERLAEEYQLIFYECSAASGHNVAESMVSLIRSLKVREDQLRNKAEDVPKLPQKKKGCC